MKTLFMYIQDDLDYFFFEKEGDYSHLHQVFINISDQEELLDEVAEICGSLEESQILKVPTKDWDIFAVVGHAV